MERCGALIAVFIVYASFVPTMQTHGEIGNNVERDDQLAILSLGKPIVSDNTLTWRYEIRNGSTQDVWICADMRYSGSEVRMAGDKKTLLVQRRIDRSLPRDRAVGVGPESTYIRLRSGETRAERMSLSLPVSPRYVFAEMRGDHPLEHATRLAIEIGYYEGDLPRMVLRMRQEAESTAPVKPAKRSASAHLIAPVGVSAGSLSFTTQNEGVRDRRELVLMNQAVKGEKVLRLEANDVNIPYQEEHRDIRLPDLTGCTRIEMKFNASALDFFFPRLNEQSLLNLAEKQYLQSMRAIVVKDRVVLDLLMNELRETFWNRDVAICDQSFADLTCYRDDQVLTSFTATLADGSKIVTSNGDVFDYYRALKSLTMLTPEIQALNLRTQCGANLRNLWHRFRLYDLARYAPADKDEFWKRVRENERMIRIEAYEPHRKIYPPVTGWCDAMLRGYRVYFQDDHATGGIMRCPSSEGSKSSYAMNPKCLYNSPADVVLLFEAKAGWNQHGGPEVFTFGNHDPKGGLVLLNDGTVKFIRTEEELKQLRWK